MPQAAGVASILRPQASQQTDARSLGRSRRGDILTRHVYRHHPSSFQALIPSPEGHMASCHPQGTVTHEVFLEYPQVTSPAI